MWNGVTDGGAEMKMKPLTEDARLLALDQRSECSDDVGQQIGIARNDLDVVERHPGPGLFDAPKHFVDGTTVRMLAVVRECRVLRNPRPDEAALPVRHQFFCEPGEFVDLEKRVLVKVVAQRLDPMGGKLRRVIDPHAECLRRGCRCFFDVHGEPP
ncbi:MAG: hypothetical protein KKC79_10675 [Gammaproteobacteria bacterium]|nr:hypothetical protein [Gammaproteobacteria bacterium]MBU2409094.1 hypothetical protein [Gammaproteobacteria bacterium]